MRKWSIRILVFTALGFAAFWLLTRPQTLPDNAFADLIGDPSAGEQVFWAAGCASCHSAPDAKDEEDKLVLSGGQRFPSPFGTFIAPNISPSPEGIGGWSTHDLGNAMLYGSSPKGQHYYPAFPYASYVRMKLRPAGLQDVANLHAYLQTLPPSSQANAAHDVSFPFNIRRGLGLWKRIFINDYWIVSVPLDDQQLQRGRYLIEALGHCAECHTPRNAVGGLLYDQWLTGAPDPSGKGRVPAVNALDWSAKDIAYYLESGFTPEFDSAGGHMVNVVENMSKLTSEDREAIAAYLKSLSEK
ncbi:cytochrome c [Lentibacter algarum]|uniref:c-type cytochrome n=1 Tax=Lentibacter algarum TaxID=576131 RepID=UPI001C07DAF4|nr:cytochrome c [Lentibacter algarum]MBU2982292.1 cytochrome c [Lentibacter algarum]